MPLTEKVLDEFERGEDATKNKGKIKNVDRKRKT